jgi:hypothetical protein
MAGISCSRRSAGTGAGVAGSVSRMSRNTPNPATAPPAIPAGSCYAQITEPPPRFGGGQEPGTCGGRLMLGTHSSRATNTAVSPAMTSCPVGLAYGRMYSARVGP